MDKEVTLYDIAQLITRLISEQRKDTDQKFELVDKKFEHLTELMVDTFDRLETKIDRVEFNTNGQEKRISILEDKVQMIGKKLGLSS